MQRIIGQPGQSHQCQQNGEQHNEVFPSGYFITIFICFIAFAVCHGRHNTLMSQYAKTYALSDNGVACV